MTCDVTMDGQLFYKRKIEYTKKYQMRVGIIATVSNALKQLEEGLKQIRRDTERHTSKIQTKQFNI